ncbi:MAG: CaiB/BaiF CoA transferase family protein, partial [Dehalococcoidia bacterium]
MSEQPESVTIGPLAGLRVIEVGGENGQWAGKLLADMGADVVKVEPPPGCHERRIGPFAGDAPDPNRSLFFWAANTSKRGVTLDLTHPDGPPLLRRLLRDADVLLTSLPPDDAGLDPTALAEEESHLIVVSVTPFGRSGPWRDFAATDLTQMALGGPMACCGYDEEDAPGAPPIRPDGRHAALIAGVYAANAVLTALLERECSGLGQWIDCSVHEACAATTEGAFPQWEYMGQIVRRQTGRHAAPVHSQPWQHRCRDGRSINLMGGGIPRNPTSWRPLIRWMAERGLAGDLEDPRYEQTMYVPVAERRGNPDVQYVVETLHAFVRSLPAEEVYRGGQAARLPYGIIRSPEENLADPHWADRGFFTQVEHPELDASYPYPGAPYRFTKTPGGPRHRAPLLGEHNVTVYCAELGVSRDDLRRLFESGVV